MQPRSAEPSPAVLPAAGTRQALWALVTGQICLHAAMAGLRLAAPLMVLREGALGVRPELAAGALLGLFALAPVLTAMPSGRWVDRRGYHKPVRHAVVLVSLGCLLAVPAAWLHGVPRALLLALAACTTGMGANLGLIAIQRSAGRLAGLGGAGDVEADPAARSAQLKRVFSWLGLAPSLANMVGPVLAGWMIDAAGFGAAFGVMALLPLATLVVARAVPREWVAPADGAAEAAAPRSPWAGVREMAALPGMASLLAVNWLFSSSWDLHSFVVPLLGHERGLSASAIGGVLGVFALAVAGVRVAVPWVAQHLPERRVLSVALVVVTAVFVVYPLAHTPLQMMACAAVLGLALGVVQPMVMTTLHHIAPPGRQGEAIALRSMTINLSSALLPLLLGALGSVMGAGGLLRLMAACLVLGLALPRRLPASG